MKGKPFPWKNWGRFAIRNGKRITNWPVSLKDHTPCDAFEVSQIDARLLIDLVTVFTEKRSGKTDVAPSIEDWTDGKWFCVTIMMLVCILMMSFSDELVIDILDVAYGDIGLVVDTEGTVLVRVSDSAEYGVQVGAAKDKKDKEAGKKAGRKKRGTAPPKAPDATVARAAASETTATRVDAPARPIRPLPRPRMRPSENTRPQKRSRTDVQREEVIDEDDPFIANAFGKCNSLYNKDFLLMYMCLDTPTPHRYSSLYPPTPLAPRPPPGRTYSTHHGSIAPTLLAGPGIAGPGTRRQAPHPHPSSRPSDQVIPSRGVLTQVYPPLPRSTVRPHPPSSRAVLPSRQEHPASGTVDAPRQRQVSMPIHGREAVIAAAWSRGYEVPRRLQLDTSGRPILSPPQAAPETSVRRHVIPSMSRDRRMTYGGGMTVEQWNHDVNAYNRDFVQGSSNMANWEPPSEYDQDDYDDPEGYME